MKTRLLKKLRKEAHLRYGMSTKKTSDGRIYFVGIRCEKGGLFGREEFRNFTAAMDYLRRIRRAYVRLEMSEMSEEMMNV